MNGIDRAIQRTVLSLNSAGAKGPERERPEAAEPAEGPPLKRPRVVIGYALAVVLPLVTAAATIPLRASHDVAAAITLAIVAVIVGVLSSRLAHLVAKNTTRRNELRYLVSFIHVADTAKSIDDLSDQVCVYLTDLLGLRTCEWLPGMQDGGGPVLLPTGALMGSVSALNPDRAVLPAHLELPVDVGRKRLGHLVLTSRPDHRTSVEERLTAATIATVFAQAAEAIQARTTG